jgi:tRNA (cytidine/uridine-2'-O-)-methyltransferase
MSIGASVAAIASSRPCLPRFCFCPSRSNGAQILTEPPPLLLALFEPDIAQNAGAMMRTCACLGVEAAIIEPAGFRMADSRFRRAGMDYVDALTIKTHDSWASFAAWRASSQRRLVLLTTKGETSLWEFAFREGDIILVGRESAGVPEDVRASADIRLRIPIQPQLRSLNVGIAATIAMTEALRQIGRLPFTMVASED